MTGIHSELIDEMPNVLLNGKAAPRSISGMSVLVTDEHYKHTLGIVRRLGQAGVNVTLMANSSQSLVALSRHCKNILQVPEGGIGPLVEATLKAVQETNFDLLLPVGFTTTLAITHRRAEFERFVRLQLASPEKIELAANKKCMAELASTVDVPVPRTSLPSSKAEWNTLAKDFTYPVVVKPLMETAGRSVSYAMDQNELLALGDSGSYFSPPSLLLQEYIPGFGCGFFATYRNGTCSRVFMHRRLREYPASGGVSTCAESFYDAKLELYGRRILDALSWHGVAMVEFRYDERDGEFKLIEVNPKFWGSLDLALEAGADFPGDLCRMAIGEELFFTNSYKRNLRYHWPFSVFGELYHLRNRPASFFSIVFDSLNPRVKSNIWPTDLKPNFAELISLGQLILQPKKG
jgi:predicted ATP-grasp superfamily ATP-dependent carboligase